MATKDPKEEDSAVPRTKSLIPEVNCSSSGLCVFRLNIACRIPGLWMIYTNSTYDCHLLTAIYS